MTQASDYALLAADVYRDARLRKNRGRIPILGTMSLCGSDDTRLLSRPKWPPTQDTWLMQVTAPGAPRTQI